MGQRAGAPAGKAPQLEPQTLLLHLEQVSRIYAQRKAIVEPVNGQIKEARGLRRFLLRGLEKIDGELHLIAATHNLLKLFRYRRFQQQAWAAARGWGVEALAMPARAQ